ncbi:MAG: tRNA (guanosine(46)-N7)-methyltransferase TrmB [Chitinophagaceae bacterium]|nr:MAG: tRNA (guanosine(46)-N7)-methyltransferase TrmB [Chitinophagaceae bacterium]
MGQKKLIRFEEIKSFDNVLQYPEGMPGTWSSYFNNELPLTLELACGKGEYAIGLAQLFPEGNYLGIDLKGNRLWVGARKAKALGLRNVAFMRTKIDQLTDYFEPGEVSSIWITFPDPQLRKSKAKKRLTHPKFLRLYQQVLTAGGKIQLKTDSPSLYRFTKKVAELYGCTVIDDLDDVYAAPDLPDELRIRTHYEGLDIAGSNRIHFISFTLPGIIPGKEKDAELKEWVFNQDTGAEKEEDGDEEATE